MSHIDILKTTGLLLTTIGTFTAIVYALIKANFHTKDKALELFSAIDHEKHCGRSFDDIKDALQQIHNEAREQRGSIDKLTNSVTELMTIQRFK